MTREELRDELLGPFLQWTRLGRQMNQMMLASIEVITQRSHGLLRGHTTAEGHDWAEMRLMTSEKVSVPIESLVAMATAMPAEVWKFWTRSGEAICACASGALSLASSRSADELRERQAQFGQALLGSALVCYQLAGSAATVADAGLAPVLRQVTDNAERLG